MEDYYDLESILADEEKVPTRFTESGKGLGYLDPGSVDVDLVKDTKLELPLWLSRTLVRKRLAVVSLPKVYHTYKKSDLRADAAVVDLHRHPFYFHVGKCLSEMLKDKNLNNELGSAFSQRYQMILDKSLFMQASGYAEFTQTLSHTETQLFLIGYNSTQEFERWKARTDDKINTATSVSNSNRKRKRPSTE